MFPEILRLYDVSCSDFIYIIQYVPVTLITRPRRFGKTLAMTMLESFFNIRKESDRYPTYHNFTSSACSVQPVSCKIFLTSVSVNPKYSFDLITVQKI